MSEPIQGSPDSAKRGFIRAFFDEFAQRVDFVKTLDSAGRNYEAAILCCAYVENIANNLNPACKNSAENFAQALEIHGADPFLAAIHPSFLVDAFPGRNASEKEAAAALRSVAADLSGQLWDKAALVRAVQNHMASECLATIRVNLWRGSIANLAYVHIRSSLFKTGLGSTSLTFSGHTFMGGTAPTLDFHRLHASLKSLLGHASRVSLGTAKWYGTIG